MKESVDFNMETLNNFYQNGKFGSKAYDDLMDIDSKYWFYNHPEVNTEKMAHYNLEFDVKSLKKDTKPTPEEFFTPLNTFIEDYYSK